MKYIINHHSDYIIRKRAGIGLARERARRELMVKLMDHKMVELMDHKMVELMDTRWPY